MCLFLFLFWINEWFSYLFIEVIFEVIEHGLCGMHVLGNIDAIRREWESKKYFWTVINNRMERWIAQILEHVNKV